jgi:hypothetical protein
LSVYSNSDPMSSDRWQRLNEIFHSALALDPAERSAFVDKAFVGDDALRRESLAMLNAPNSTSAPSSVSMPHWTKRTTPDRRAWSDCGSARIESQPRSVGAE